MNLKKCDSCGNRHMCFICEENKFYRKVNWSRDKYIKQEAIKEFSQKVVKQLEDTKIKCFVTGITSNPYEFGACHAMDKAIEIVKEEGGLNEHEHSNGHDG